MRLTLKLTAVLSLVIACGLLAQAFVHVQKIRTLYSDDALEDLQGYASVLGATVEQVWAQQGPVQAQTLVERLNSIQSDIAVQLHAPGQDTGPLITIYDTSLRLNRQLVVGSIPVATLTLTKTRQVADQEVSSVIWNQLATVAAVVGACCALALVVGFWLVGRPIEQLIEHARRVGDEDYDTGGLPVRRDELGRLSREMKSMSEKLSRVTDRVAQERRRRTRAYEQLRHADRLSTVGKLASGIAHELGTPLNVVAGRATMIMADADASKTVRKNAQKIVSQSEHMESIVRQLLNFSRRKQLQKTQTDAQAILDNAATLVEPLAEEHDVSVTVVASDVASITLDAGKILQVLTNLIVNAIQAMPGGGQIWLKAYTKAIANPPDKHAAPGRFVCFEVKDQGKGISTDELSHIFEPFFTTKEVGTGTGLGLSVCHGIVREHGGWIHVDSEPGQGSTFQVFMPTGEAT